MPLDIDLLLTWGASIKEYKKKEIIFNEDGLPMHYYQIISGRVAMYNINDDGKEFYQGFFEQGESFGEPPLFINKPYPSTAIAYPEAVIIRLHKNSFFDMLNSSASIQMYFTQVLAQRIYDKANSSKILMVNDAEERIIGFLDNIKNKLGSSSERILIPQTRQEIANIIGLRVETVIRTLSKLQDQKIVEIRNHKLYY